MLVADASRAPRARRDEHDPLIQQLRAWGRATATRYCVVHGDRRTHALDRAREFAPGTRERAALQLAGRNGQSRREWMARDTGMRMVPEWSCDPVPAHNDADRPHDNPVVAVDQGIPDELRWIDSALLSIRRRFPIRELVLRVEFTEPGTQRMKAGRVSRIYGGALSLWQYRRELQCGIDMLRVITC